MNNIEQHLISIINNLKIHNHEEPFNIDELKKIINDEDTLISMLKYLNIDKNINLNNNNDMELDNIKLDYDLKNDQHVISNYDLKIDQDLISNYEINNYDVDNYELDNYELNDKYSDRDIDYDHTCSDDEDCYNNDEDNEEMHSQFIKSFSVKELKNIRNILNNND